MQKSFKPSFKKNEHRKTVILSRSHFDRGRFRAHEFVLNPPREIKTVLMAMKTGHFSRFLSGPISDDFHFWIFSNLARHSFWAHDALQGTKKRNLASKKKMQYNVRQPLFQCPLIFCIIDNCVPYGDISWKLSRTWVHRKVIGHSLMRPITQRLHFW